ncbi:MAG TPA: S8 family serine peptidase [Pyrinomonadaceae bacterium]|jgi:serine protease AprX
MKSRKTIFKTICWLVLVVFAFNSAHAGISIVKSNGITLTGADGITLTGADGITLTGADGFLSYRSNGITLTGADGIPLVLPNGITLTGADGGAYTGTNGITLTGADGITLTGADGITLTGADGITLTGADGTTYRADSIVARRPDGITLTGVDGITLTGADGITLTGADGITLTGADGITLTGADGITLTGADSIIGYTLNGVAFSLLEPNGITLTGADGITLTGADGITLTGADGITLTGADQQAQNLLSGLQSVDPELALKLNELTDDSNVNAVLVFHRYPTADDLTQLKQIGIFNGTIFRVLPMIVVTATRRQLIEASHLPNVRSIYGNRTLTFNSDPYFNKTAVQQIAADADLKTSNAGFPVSGKNVTVAVLDTGVNALHPDLAGKVVQNVKLLDLQSAAVGFMNPLPLENLPNTDLISGHGTFVAGVIAGSGAGSGGKYNGVAPGANILGLGAGDINLFHVLSGFDYLLEKGAAYNTRVVNCSFSANTLYDENDPVNVATKMLADRNISVVFSAGNTGAGNGTLNPYAAAPWVVSVGATDEKGNLAGFSSRGIFGNATQNPSIVAPGVNIVGPRALATQTGTLGVVGADLQRLNLLELPFYTTASGTSFSAPQVAGTIAMMLEANPNLTPKQIKDILQRSATPLPANYRHEVGAGMLNAYAAVLESAFPRRRTGLFRSVLDSKAVDFSTSIVKAFNQTVVPGTVSKTDFTLPENTVQASVTVGWGFSVNDLGLKVVGSGGQVQGVSNNLNLTGLTGRREKVNLYNPPGQNFQMQVSHTGNVGTAQNYFGLVEISQIDYSRINDLGFLPLDARDSIFESIRTFVMLPKGRVFHPNSPVSRAEFAETFVRSGTVLQFVANSPMYADVNDGYTRSVVESVQSNQGGKLIFDANPGGAFKPDNLTTKLVAAIAFVRAAKLENLVSTTSLPLSVADYAQIPSQYRGYAAVALQKGFLKLDGGSFNSNRAITRLELAQAINAVNRLPR